MMINIGIMLFIGAAACIFAALILFKRRNIPEKIRELKRSRHAGLKVKIIKNVINTHGDTEKIRRRML